MTRQFDRYCNNGRQLDFANIWRKWYLTTSNSTSLIENSGQLTLSSKEGSIHQYKWGRSELQGRTHHKNKEIAILKYVVFGRNLSGQIGYMDNHGETRVGVAILAIWGTHGRNFVYEGCNKRLLDGRECSRSTSGQWTHYPASHRPRDRQGHTCKRRGEGRFMYHFFIQTDFGIYHVWDKVGIQLFGFRGAEFKRLYAQGEDRYAQGEDRQKLFQGVMEELWTITIIDRNEFEHGRITDIQKMYRKKLPAPGIQVAKVETESGEEQSSDNELLTTLSTLQINDEGAWTKGTSWIVQ